jgi:hypothetical protein
MAFLWAACGYLPLASYALLQNGGASVVLLIGGTNPDKTFFALGCEEKTAYSTSLPWMEAELMSHPREVYIQNRRKNGGSE